jgi:hypothetical protein
MVAGKYESGDLNRKANDMEPRTNAMTSSGAEIRTIDRDALVEKLNGTAPIRLVMGLNEWAFRAKHIPGSEH